MTNDDQQKLFEHEQPAESSGRIECLGMSFPSEEARRAHFLEKLRESLQDSAFRRIEGFPIGSDDDILALSDPPYYTACPNPFIPAFMRQYGTSYDSTKPYSCEPFAADVSEGKNDSIYNAHSYHTKVPHKAIMRYILHYTEPGDVVFDGFCGTGMTGVAAQLCADKAMVESLGYKVDKDGTVFQERIGENGTKFWEPFARLGARRAVLNDLSPAATFIAYNYNTPIDIQAFEREAKRLLKEVQDTCGWMYETTHTDGVGTGRINYTVWSDVFICSECMHEIVFWEAAVDKTAGTVLKEFPCPHCHAVLSKRRLEHAWTTNFDKEINQTIRQAKQVPVLINYSVGKNRYEKVPDAFDLALIARIADADIPHWFPVDRMPDGEESRRNDDIGITHVHHFFTKRNLYVFSALYDRAHSSLLKCALLGGYTVGLKTARFLPLRWINKDTGPMKPHTAGTLYVPSLNGEQNWFNIFAARVQAAIRAQRGLRGVRSLQHTWSLPIVSTASSSSVAEAENLVDYSFTDPPFGGNLMYSELNFVCEAWLRVVTNNKTEAIQNKVQQKGLLEYQELMARCFNEYSRLLKPGRWITVEFHNSKNAVWNAIQEALQHVGYVIADIRTLDKKQGSFKQVTSASAVKQDLIISAYKPNGGLESRFRLTAGTDEDVWDFVRTHMRQLPVFVSKDGHAEAIAERQNFLLFDRMVAFHVQRGVTVPLSATEFYAGLEQRFPPRDGMYFLTEQVAEYDRKRMTVKEVLQLELYVKDEESALQWLKQQFTKKPQTFQEIHPHFMKELGGWEKYERSLELAELLEQNFLRYDGTGDVPSQIHSYLSSNFKELRSLEKSDSALRAKAKDRWYVPDPRKAGDLEKLRDRALLKEFDEYRESAQKKLKVFRLEAVRAGFRRAWQDRDYATIIAVARKIPESVLQEDPKLLMWFDQALTRTGEDS